MDITITLTDGQWTRTQASLKALGVGTGGADPTAAEAASWLKDTLKGITVNHEENAEYDKAKATADAAKQPF
jgi:hypothetical protein